MQASATGKANGEAYRTLYSSVIAFAGLVFCFDFLCAEYRVLLRNMVTMTLHGEAEDIPTKVIDDEKGSCYITTANKASDAINRSVSVVDADQTEVIARLKSL